MFLTTVKEVKLEVRPLFLPQLVQLTSMLKPGLKKITVCVGSNIVNIVNPCYMVALTLVTHGLPTD